MIRPLAPWLVLLLVQAVGCASAPRRNPELPPNLIVIMTDDQGYEEWQGENSRIHTPNLYKLARQGFVFENFHAMQVCSPTRAALLTGRYGQRNGVTTLMNHFEHDHRAMPVRELTIAEVLRKTGYRTALIGKWHLSDRRGSVARYGFDHFYGFLRGSTSYVNPKNFHRNDQPLGKLQGYSTDLLADEAVDFIRNHHAQPFFLLFTPNAPHAIVVGKQEDLRHYPEKHFSRAERHFYATISSVDRALARIRETLEELELDRSTIVIFISDNGSGIDERGKGSLFGTGTHVPCVVWAPGRVARGSSSQLVGILDLFPTLTEWARAPLPERLVVDGRSMVPALERGDRSALHRIKFREWNGGYSAFDLRYRLMLTPVKHRRLRPALYDLEQDPAEARNLLDGATPEILEVYERMKAEIVQWQRDTRPSRRFRLPQTVQ